VNKPPTGQSPFQRGERLTAAKLNEWVTKRPTVVAYGQGHTEGGEICVDQRETMYLRLTAKSGTSPIKYAWQQVYRAANGTWSNMTHTGNTTNDYAVELNNTDLSTTDNYVYRAERSLTTGEWLFFSCKCPSSNCEDGNCTSTPEFICTNFTPEPYSYGDPPLWYKTPGEIEYYDPPFEACKHFEWPNGHSSNSFNIYYKARELAAQSICANVTLGSTEQTTLSVKPDLEPFMPIISRIEYEKDGDPCPVESFRQDIETELVDADLITDATLTSNGSCGFNFTITRKVRITTRSVITTVDSTFLPPTNTTVAGRWVNLSPPFLNPEGDGDVVEPTLDAVNTTYTTDVYTLSESGVIPCDSSSIDFDVSIPEAVFGGDESSEFSDAYYGGDEDSSFTESIYGGSE